MRAKTLLVTTMLSVVLFAGCGLKSNEAIITVNNQKITQGEFDKLFDKQASGGMFQALKIDLKDGKNDFMYTILKDRVVNELIVKALLEQEMAKRDIKVTDKDVNEAVKDIIDKVGSKQRLDEILKQNGITSAQFKTDLKEEVKMKKLAQQLGSFEITDAEANKYYKDNIKKFQSPEKVRAMHILISANPKEIEEIIRSDAANSSLDNKAILAKVNEEMKAKEAKAKELLAQAKKDPKQFAQIAKENSDDTGSANQGGDLGFFAAQEMVPEFSKAAFSMKPNTISDKLVKTQFGYHIIMVTDRATAKTEDFNNVKDRIKEFLSNQKQIEAVDNLVESLKKTSDIKYVNADFNPENIQKDLQKIMKDQEDKNKKASEEKSEKK